ncbi:MAG: ATP-binding protein [Lachnospiraceae bacterium]|nr:ATP-binding protein [Lachnospiraceae bacterium]
MGLTNSQYDEIMRDYQRRQNQARRELVEREREVRERIPAFADLDEQIAAAGVACARAMLLDDRISPAGITAASAAMQDQIAVTDRQKTEDHTDLRTLKESIDRISVRKAQLMKAAGYPEDYLQMRYECPDCQDTGYIGQQKCHCFLKAEIDLLYTQSNLREHYKEETFPAFSLRYYAEDLKDPSTGLTAAQMASHALEVCRQFVQEFDETAGNLFLSGGTGLGKTFLSHCIANALLETTHSVIYFSAYDLFELLADSSFGRTQEAEAGELERHIFECDLLIIDDLGTEQTNSFVASQLFHVLNERILRQKSTLISTNLSLGEMAERYSERVVSRITGSYQMLKLIGEDIRIQKKYGG